jgi:hypothetical protein
MISVFYRAVATVPFGGIHGGIGLFDQIFYILAVNGK